MRVSVCVGNYAKTPYCIPGLEIEVYCMEELCYCMKENAFLLDLSVMNDQLLVWIESGSLRGRSTRWCTGRGR